MVDATRSKRATADAVALFLILYSRYAKDAKYTLRTQGKRDYGMDYCLNFLRFFSAFFARPLRPLRNFF